MNGLARPPRTPSAAAADLVVVAVLVSGVAVLIDADLEGGLRFFGVAVLLVWLRWLDVPRPFLAAFGLGLLLSSWANAAAWYQDVWWMDVVLHFGLTGATAAMAYLVLARLDVLPALHDGVVGRRAAPVVVLTVALGLAIGALWEVYEWIAVEWLDQTSIIVGYDDTIHDLVMDGLGSLVAGFLLLWWARTGHGVRARTPERSRGLDARR
jgi:hypothetical protein